MKSTLRVGPSKKATPTEAPPPKPGGVCPNCQQKHTPPEKPWGSYESAPHENPFDRIRFLANDVVSLREDLRDAQKDVEKLEFSVPR